MCNVMNCQTKTRARGLCAAHYGTWYKKVQKDNLPQMPVSSVNRFSEWSPAEIEEYWQFVKRELKIA